MFESFLAVPLHFTVEFLGFLVFAGSAVLILARPDTLDIGQVGRSMTAAGFAVAAGANVVHGANFQFALNDGDEVLVVARAIGFLLIAGGLSVPAKSAAALPAVGAFKIREPLLFLPAATALLASFSAWKRARSKPGSNLEAVAVGTALLAVAEVLTAVAPRGHLFGSCRYLCVRRSWRQAPRIRVPRRVVGKERTQFNSHAPRRLLRGSAGRRGSGAVDRAHRRHLQQCR